MIAYYPTRVFEMMVVLEQALLYSTITLLEAFESICQL